MKGLMLIIFSSMICLSVYSQETITEEHTGKVTYQSSQNTYVSFESTEGIKENDTLFTKSGGKNIPAVIVRFLSSHSCAGPLTGKVQVKTGDQLSAIVKTATKKKVELASVSGKDETEALVQSSEVQPKNLSLSRNPVINLFSGRFSIQSYSSFSNLRGAVNSQRWRYSLSSETKNLFGSGLILSNYITFSYNAQQWEKERKSLANNIRIYDLSLQYDYNKSTHIWAGRYINPKISSISSIDGLQIEKKWGSFYGGIVAGSRPDLSDFGFNLKLFESGAYLGRSDTLSEGIMNNTLAFFSQTNDFKTDRRFLYFQHDDYVFKNLSFFLSSEMDLYTREKGEGKSTVSLTSLYLMSSYSPLSWLSVSLSYDARKNVIYYETFKNFADSLFDKQTRQGIRGGISLRPMNYMYIGFDAGYRYERSDIKPSRNYSAYVSYARIPWLDMSASCNISNLTSSYVDGLIYGINITKDLFSGLLSSSAGYRRIEYSFTSVSEKLKEHILSLDLSLMIMKNIYIITGYEGIFEKANSNGRVLVEVSSRF